MPEMWKGGDRVMKMNISLASQVWLIWSRQLKRVSRLFPPASFSCGWCFIHWLSEIHAIDLLGAQSLSEKLRSCSQANDAGQQPLIQSHDETCYEVFVTDKHVLQIVDNSFRNITHILFWKDVSHTGAGQTLPDRVPLLSGVFNHCHLYSSVLSYNRDFVCVSPSMCLPAPQESQGSEENFPLCRTRWVTSAVRAHCDDFTLGRWKKKNASIGVHPQSLPLECQEQATTAKFIMYGTTWLETVYRNWLARLTRPKNMVTLIWQRTEHPTMYMPRRDSCSSSCRLFARRRLYLVLSIASKLTCTLPGLQSSFLPILAGTKLKLFFPSFSFPSLFFSFPFS